MNAGVHELGVTAVLSPERRFRLLRTLVVDIRAPIIEILHPSPAALLSGDGFSTRNDRVRIVGRVRDPDVPLDLGEKMAVRVASQPEVMVHDGFAVQVSLNPLGWSG